MMMMVLGHTMTQISLVSFELKKTAILLHFIPEPVIIITHERSKRF